MVGEEIIELRMSKIKSEYTLQHFMPLISVSMYPGRTQKQKDEFAKAITNSAVDILKTKEEHVIVVFDENSRDNWFLAGKQL